MLQVRRASERGGGDHGWLRTAHTFSFADYFDPEHMGFRTLRVLNEDVVAPGTGFGTHPHRDMEIITHVLSGKLEHKDSMGNKGVIAAGEWQRMSAGTGVLHSEYNPSESEPVHLYQIWLLPNQKNLTPSYEERRFTERKPGEFFLAASPDGRDGSMVIHQDAELYLAAVPEGGEVVHPLRKGRHAWVQVLSGDVEVNGERLTTSDAAAASDERELRFRAERPAEVMVFDLA